MSKYKLILLLSLFLCRLGGSVKRGSMNTRIFYFVLAVVYMFVMGCTSLPLVKKKSVPNSPNQTSEQVIIENFPEEPEQSKVAPQKIKKILGRKEVKIYRPKIGVIFGPGLFKTAGHLGVLKEFKAQDIPIHSVAGLGWASTVSWLYNEKKSVDWMQWRLEQSNINEVVKTQVFNRNRYIFPLPDIKEWFLKAFFENRFTGSKKTNFCLQPLQNEPQSSDFFQCLNIPPVREAQFSTGGFPWKYLVQKLKDSGAEKIIYIHIKGNPLETSKKDFSQESFRYWSGWAAYPVPEGLVDFTLYLDLPGDGLDTLEIRSWIRQSQRQVEPLVSWLKSNTDY